MLNWSFRVTEITILAIYYYKLHREAKESYRVFFFERSHPRWDIEKKKHPAFNLNSPKRVLRSQHCC